MALHVHLPSKPPIHRPKIQRKGMHISYQATIIVFSTLSKCMVYFISTILQYGNHRDYSQGQSSTHKRVTFTMRMCSLYFPFHQKEHTMNILVLLEGEMKVRRLLGVGWRLREECKYIYLMDWVIMLEAIPQKHKHSVS